MGFANHYTMQIWDGIAKATVGFAKLEFSAQQLFNMEIDFVKYAQFNFFPRCHLIS